MGRRRLALWAGTATGLWCLCVVPVGCVPSDWLLDDDPESAVPAEVVASLVNALGVPDDQVLFLGNGFGIDAPPEQDRLAQAKAFLETQRAGRVLFSEESCLDSERVLVPVDCDTGERGVIVLIGSVRASGDGSLVVEAGIVRGGLDAEFYEYTLVSEAGVWRVVSARLIGIA